MAVGLPQALANATQGVACERRLMRVFVLDIYETVALNNELHCLHNTTQPNYNVLAEQMFVKITV